LLGRALVVIVLVLLLSLLAFLGILLHTALVKNEVTSLSLLTSLVNINAKSVSSSVLFFLSVCQNFALNIQSVAHIRVVYIFFLG